MPQEPLAWRIFQFQCVKLLNKNAPQCCGQLLLLNRYDDRLPDTQLTYS